MSENEIRLSEKHIIYLQHANPRPSDALEHIRQLYPKDSKAQQEIDVFDEESPYNQNLERLSEALENGDDDVVLETQEWLYLNYPDVFFYSSLSQAST